MKKRRSAQIAIALIAILCIISWGLSHTFGNTLSNRLGVIMWSILCNMSETQAVRSPDGTRIATVVDCDCGIRESYTVVIKYNSLRQLLGGDKIAISRYPLNVEWKDKNHLTVNCEDDHYLKVNPKVTLLDDLHITYKIEHNGTN